jgi:protein tyrosine phosphatase (PTP) superfamily phosphohydrolase (DUF442 family)
MSMNTQTLRVLGIALFGILFSLPALAQPTGIFNFGQVDPGYYRGGELKGHDAADLAALGVKTVIDLRSDDDYDPAEGKLVEDAGMKYVRIPMTTRVAPTPAQLSKFLALVSHPATDGVYVHCVEGRHRTGVMTAFYRMTVDNWTSEQAFSEMKKYKFGADWLHPEFKKFVYAYRAAPSAPASPGVLALETAVPATN